jgi:hypothetical protein
VFLLSTVCHYDKPFGSFCSSLSIIGLAERYKSYAIRKKSAAIPGSFGNLLNVFINSVISHIRAWMRLTISAYRKAFYFNCESEMKTLAEGLHCEV